MDTKVVKRDGKIEDFDTEKIVRVVMAAGLDEDKAKVLAGEIAAWVTETKPEKLTSIQLRDIVIGKLHKFDEASAKMYIWYQSTK